MSLQARDSLDFVEMLMVLEEVLGTEIPEGGATHCESPHEIVDWLEPLLSSKRPTKQAAELLRSLAKSQNNPALAEGLDGLWRREQIAAIIRQMFRE
jgi:hypothetical protein